MLDMLHLLTVACLFAAAWLISRGAAYVARKVLLWHDRHTEAAAATVDLRIANVKRRETTVAVIRAAIAYAAFAVAIVLSAAQLTGGLNKLTTLAGASFVIILAGFAIQRVLMDVIAGTMMFVEHWYAVGDTIAIPTLELQGIVEDVSLRRTKLRTLDGETIQVSNSQIPAVRVLPEGLKELATARAARTSSARYSESCPKARPPSRGDRGSRRSTSSTTASSGSGCAPRSSRAASGSSRASSPTCSRSGRTRA